MLSRITEVTTQYLPASVILWDAAAESFSIGASTDDIYFLKALANRAALAIFKVQVYEKLRQAKGSAKTLRHLLDEIFGQANTDTTLPLM